MLRSIFRKIIILLNIMFSGVWEYLQLWDLIWLSGLAYVYIVAPRWLGCLWGEAISKFVLSSNPDSHHSVLSTNTLAQEEYSSSCSINSSIPTFQRLLTIIRYSSSSLFWQALCGHVADVALKLDFFSIPDLIPEIQEFLSFPKQFLKFF